MADRAIAKTVVVLVTMIFQLELRLSVYICKICWKRVFLVNKRISLRYLLRVLRIFIFNMVNVKHSRLLPTF